MIGFLFLSGCLRMALKKCTSIQIQCSMRNMCNVTSIFCTDSHRWLYNLALSFVSLDAIQTFYCCDLCEKKKIYFSLLWFDLKAFPNKHHHRIITHRQMNEQSAVMCSRIDFQMYNQHHRELFSGFLLLTLSIWCTNQMYIPMRKEYEETITLQQIKYESCVK